MNDINNNNDINENKNLEDYTVTIDENKFIRKKKNKFIQHCESCDFTANRALEWLKHIESEKHLRNGERKESKCDKCNKLFSSKWALNQHHLIHHATKEEKLKHKYYCNICDVVFFMEKNFVKHNNGKIHNNLVKIYEYNTKNNIPIDFIKN
jgi:hypothetical protein